MGARLSKPRVAGYMLMEVLVSLVIFSIGILGVSAMQVVSLRADSAAKYRTDASILANLLIGRMWADDRTPAVLQANYQGSGGSGGPGYRQWVGEIGAANGIYLPRVAEVPPEVKVEPKDGNLPPNSAKSLVTVTVYWLMPGDNNDAKHRHSYVATAEIK